MRLRVHRYAPGDGVRIQSYDVDASAECSGRVQEEEFLQIVRGASQTAGRTLQIFHVGGAGPDHPVSSLYPEGRYLKAVFARVL
jgi:23S rRNA (cytosine1962-C5)-methyltransferase